MAEVGELHNLSRVVARWFFRGQLLPRAVVRTVTVARRGNKVPFSSLPDFYLMRKLLISFTALLLLLAGCSTPQTRAKSHAELMETLTPEERALVEAGQVDLGFTEEMVLVALGKPDRKYSERTAERESVVWAYHARGGLSGLSVGVGTSMGRSSRGSVYGGGVSVGTGSRRHPDEKMRVVFEEGVVIGIEQAER
jgi:hypothetical protein